jgi:hypothetical protein
MVVAYVKPVSVSAGTAFILVLIEQAFLGALPTLAYVFTSVGPFVPLVASAWSRRKILSVADAQYVFEPLYEEILKNRDSIRSTERWSNIPMFQRNALDQIRMGARYSLLKERTPSVEALCASMDAVSSSHGDVIRAINRIIVETTGPVLGIGGEAVSFRGRTKDGGYANYEGSAWINPMLIRGRNPLTLLTQQGVDVESMGITDRNNNIKGTVNFPNDEAKYTKFLGSVEKKARDDPDIKKMRDAVSSLSTLSSEAEKEVLKEIRKSRSIF